MPKSFKNTKVFLGCPEILTYAAQHQVTQFQEL